MLCTARRSVLTAFSLFTRRLPILRLAREHELENDLILVEEESIEIPSKAASFSSASRLAFSRRSLANASASSASAKRRALRAWASAREELYKLRDELYKLQPQQADDFYGL